MPHYQNSIKPSADWNNKGLLVIHTACPVAGQLVVLFYGVFTQDSDGQRQPILWQGQRHGS